MGTIESGRTECPDRRKRAVEECRSLAVRDYLAGRAPADVGRLELVTTRPHLGGERRWLSCPRCRFGVATLYQPDPAAAWACRTCCGLTYRSRRQSRRTEGVKHQLARYFAHMERTGGDWSTVFDGLGHRETIALCRAFIALDLDRQADAREAMGADHKSSQNGCYKR